MLKNKRLLAGPYLFWAVSFVVIPLAGDRLLCIYQR